jgi:inner membrane protein
MDSLSQLALGAAIGLAVAPANQRRRALIYGAALGTLPDLDALVSFGGPVENFTYHRSASHSLLVLPIIGCLLFAVARRFDPAIRAAPRAWLAIFLLALLTHPLLDWFTIYGTQLFWPIDPTPYGLGSMFIIDPLYTVPLLLAIALALGTRVRSRAPVWARAGLVVSCLYLGWSAFAQALVERRASEFAGGAPMLALPTPFNTVLWRIVVREPGQYRVGYHSLLDPAAAPAPERAVPSADEWIPALQGQWTFDRLRWFTHGFFAIEKCGEEIVLSDLRMGVEPAYVFTFAIAQAQSDEVHELRPARAIGDRRSDRAGAVFGWMGDRIVAEPSALKTDPLAIIGTASCLHGAGL